MPVSPACRPLLDVQDLYVRFRDREAPAVRGISFTLGAGECVAVIGESGAGKTTIARSLLGLDKPGSTVTAARMTFRGRDLLELDDREWSCGSGCDVRESNPSDGRATGVDGRRAYGTHRR